MTYDEWVEKGRPHWQCQKCRRIMVTVPQPDDWLCGICKGETIHRNFKVGQMVYMAETYQANCGGLMSRSDQVAWHQPSVRAYNYLSGDDITCVLVYCHWYPTCGRNLVEFVSRFLVFGNELEALAAAKVLAGERNLAL